MRKQKKIGLTLRKLNNILKKDYNISLKDRIDNNSFCDGIIS